MVECYIKTVKEHLRKVVQSHQRDWDERLPLFLLHYGLDPSSGSGWRAAAADRKKNELVGYLG
jgi:hypothetical protein